MNKQIFSKRLKSRRKELKYTILKMANICHITEICIIRYENKYSNYLPTRSIFNKLLNVLDIEGSYFL